MRRITYLINSHLGHYPSLHQVDEDLPSTALVRRSEQNAQDVALTELLPHFP